MQNEPHKNGLWTWIGTGCIDESDSIKSVRRILSLVREYKNHPSLLCWEIQDEPAYTWNSAELRVPPNCMINTYRLIKEEDPEHYIYTNHAPVNLISTLRRYNPATDIVACDIYPVIPHGIRITVFDSP